MLTQSISLPRNRRYGDEEARRQRARRRVVDPALERTRGRLCHRVKMSDTPDPKELTRAKEESADSCFRSLAFSSSSFVFFVFATFFVELDLHRPSSFFLEGPIALSKSRPCALPSRSLALRWPRRGPSDELLSLQHARADRKRPRRAGCWRQWSGQRRRERRRWCSMISVVVAGARRRRLAPPPPQQQPQGLRRLPLLLLLHQPGTPRCTTSARSSLTASSSASPPSSRSPSSAPGTQRASLLRPRPPRSSPRG